MEERDRSTAPPGAGWTPVPDPTMLTSAMIDRAKEDMRRELEAMRQLLMQRLDDMALATKLLQDWRETLPRRLDDAMGCHKDVIDQRFRTVEEQFHSVAIQFTNMLGMFSERDTRSDMMAQSGEKNIASALAAAKELVSAQNTSSANAIEKGSRDTDKRIDTTVQLLQTTTAALDQRITVLADQTKMLMSRTESETSSHSLSTKMDQQNMLLQTLTNGLDKRVTLIEGRSGGMKDSWGTLLAVIGAMGVLFGLWHLKP